MSLKFGLIPNQGKWGEPLIPTRSLNIGFHRKQAILSVISSSYKTVPGSGCSKAKIVKNGKKTDLVYEIGKNYSTPNRLGSGIVRFGKYGLMRSVPVQLIIVSPMEYNAAQRTIKF